LIRKGETLVLADCGGGTAHRLHSKVIGANDLDAVYITHYHPDHFSGIFMLIQMLYLMGRTKALPVFLPERPAALMEILQLMYTFSDKFPFRLQILDMEQAEQFFPWIKPIPTDHLFGYANLIRAHNLANQMKSWSLKFTGETGSLVYTSDLTTTDCIAEAIRGTHTVIVDAGHPDAEQIFKMKYLDIGRIILTHGISAGLQTRIDELDKSLYEFAREDFVYYV
jgi:ribonuclease BN (tRNA processing enzyme)